MRLDFFVTFCIKTKSFIKNLNFCFFYFKAKESKNFFTLPNFSLLLQRKVTKESFTILLAPKVSKTVLFFGRIFLFSTHLPPQNKTADSKIPRSARARPSIFSQLYLRKIKIHALKSLCVGLHAILFRLMLWHFKMLRKNRVVSKARASV